MYGRIIEATNDFNWGKFMLARFDWEWGRRSEIGGTPLLRSLGWDPNASSLWVLDLQTGEGAYLHPAQYSSVRADLKKHRIWVCPMFEPFLQWLYQQDLSDLDKLPSIIRLPDAESAVYGYRRPGPCEQCEDVKAAVTELTHELWGDPEAGPPDIHEDWSHRELQRLVQKVARAADVPIPEWALPNDK